MKKILSIVFLMAAALTIVSCSESNDTVDEYANWQTRNDDFFAKVYRMAQDSIAAGKTNWRIYNKYTIGDTTDIQNKIVVKVISEGQGTTSPIMTDTTACHYAGYIMPSDTYNSRPYSFYPTNVGYCFQRTWSGDYDLSLMSTTKLCGNIIGFDTALMHMHKGDRWLIYIPYKIGYNATAKTGIPAYSTVIFDLTLSNFWHPVKK